MIRTPLFPLRFLIFLKKLLHVTGRRPRNRPGPNADQHRPTARPDFLDRRASSRGHQSLGDPSDPTQSRLPRLIPNARSSSSTSEFARASSRRLHVIRIFALPSRAGPPKVSRPKLWQATDQSQVMVGQDSATLTPSDPNLKAQSGCSMTASARRQAAQPVPVRRRRVCSMRARSRLLAQQHLSQSRFRGRWSRVRGASRTVSRVLRGAGWPADGHRESRVTMSRWSAGTVGGEDMGDEKATTAQLRQAIGNRRDNAGSR